MISVRAAKRLWDAVDAGNHILRFTAEVTADQYVENVMLRSAVERQFEIIGEALSVLRRDNPEVAARIPDLAKIVGLRNILAHQYDAVRDDTLLLVAAVDLPRLMKILSALLEEAPRPGV